MRQFSSAGFRIWNLSREAKVVYTFFGVCSLLALASTVLLYEDMVGPGTPGIGAYYDGAQTGSRPTGAGDARTPGPSTAAPTRSPGGGPEIALPDEPAASGAPITVAVSYRKLLEVTHFHLFTVPVFLLIITHLFMLTGLSPAAKLAWIAAGWVSSLGHLAAPWVVHYGGGGAAWIYALSGAALGVTTLVLTLYPIWAMWTGSSPKASTAQAAP